MVCLCVRSTGYEPLITILLPGNLPGILREYSGTKAEPKTLRNLSKTQTCWQWPPGVLPGTFSDSFGETPLPSIGALTLIPMHTESEGVYLPANLPEAAFFDTMHRRVTRMRETAQTLRVLKTHQSICPSLPSCLPTSLTAHRPTPLPSCWT